MQVGNAATLPIAISPSGPSLEVGNAVTLPIALNDNSANFTAVITQVWISFTFWKFAYCCVCKCTKGCLL